MVSENIVQDVAVIQAKLSSIVAEYHDKMEQLEEEIRRLKDEQKLWSDEARKVYNVIREIDKFLGNPGVRSSSNPEFHID